MTINVTCSACNKPYRLPDDWAGRKAKCKACGQTIQIPNAGGAAEDDFGLPPASGAVTAAAGQSCPVCESPLAAGVCSVCGYSTQASTTLARAPVATGTASTPKRRAKSGDSAADSDSSSSRAASRLMTVGAIAGAVIIAVVLVGLLAMKIIAAQAEQNANDRLVALMIHLHETQQAYFVGDADWETGIDMEQVIRDGAAEFAADLPYAPGFIAELEPKDNEVADDRKRWVNELIENLPAGTDLSPLEEIPANSFAYEAAQSRLKKG